MIVVFKNHVIEIYAIASAILDIYIFYFSYVALTLIFSSFLNCSSLHLMIIYILLKFPIVAPCALYVLLKLPFRVPSAYFLMMQEELVLFFIACRNIVWMD
jgi:hypothetical protein